MNNKYIEDFEAVKQRFEQWWKGELTGAPLMYVTAAGKAGNVVLQREISDLSEIYLDVERIVGDYRNFCETNYFLADSYPNVGVDLGAGSMALYLGSEPVFAEDTIWFTETADECEDLLKLKFDPQNKWYIKHLDMLRQAKALSGDDFIVNIPDIIENADILSALRGPQNLCYDIMDYPDVIKQAVDIVDDLYFRYYDKMYDIIKQQDGTSSFTAFNVIGSGKTAKIQCDFCALISPDSFDQFILPSLTKQCQNLKHSVYHLDGPDAIKHLPSLMSIKELDALQWTCGAGQPDGGCEKWYPIYDQVTAAGKSLWIMLYDGQPRDWLESAERIIKRYGKQCVYFYLPTFPDLQTAEGFIEAMNKI